MAAMWLSGFEEHPDDSGEICVVEVFGRSVEDHSAEVGVGVKQLHDPRLVHDFVTPRIEIDVSEFHTYAVAWNAQAADFFVDEVQVHSCAAPPTYPMQAMLAVFDFPGWSTGDDDHLVPSFDIDWVSGDPLSTTP
jgi:beta-glucanase (GH16 family)